MKYLVFFVLLLLLITIIYYNMMLRKANNIKNILASIDSLLKERNDLIPNLVQVVKGYMKYEQEELERLVLLRSRGGNEQIDEELPRLMYHCENYPSLKANHEFLHLQKELVRIEDELQAGRRTYNAIVTHYNNFISFFPNLIFAKLLSFHKYPLFHIDKREGKRYYE